MITNTLDCAWKYTGRAVAPRGLHMPAAPFAGILRAKEKVCSPPILQQPLKHHFLVYFEVIFKVPLGTLIEVWSLQACPQEPQLSGQSQLRGRED